MYTDLSVDEIKRIARNLGNIRYVIRSLYFEVINYNNIKKHFRDFFKQKELEYTNEELCGIFDVCSYLDLYTMESVHKYISLHDYKFDIDTFLSSGFANRLYFTSLEQMSDFCFAFQELFNYYEMKRAELKSQK